MENPDAGKREPRERFPRRLAATAGSGKLASRAAPVHHHVMRRLAPFAALLVAACATAPQPAPTPVTPAIPQGRTSGTLIGLTASELIAQFGQPSFQVREGPGVKLQWARAGCVLDAYLYPPAGRSGAERVRHVDTRRPSGDNVPQAGCVAALAVR